MAFKVDLYLDARLSKTIELEYPVTIKEIVSSERLTPFQTISFKLNNKFVNSSKLIVEDSTLVCVGFKSTEGFRIYQDSTIFIMAKAFYKLYNKSMRLVVEHSIGDGIFCEAFGDEEFTEKDLQAVKSEMLKIVEKELYVEEIEMGLEEAKNIFIKQGRNDVVRNLHYNHKGFVPVFRCGGYYDYFIRQLCDNTGLIRDFELNINPPGFVIRYPNKRTGKIKEEFNYPKKLFQVHQEADKWLNIFDVHNVSDVNDKIEHFDIQNVILVEEALHEKKIVNFAKEITDKGNVRAVFIAGPSSSGKTTFAKRLSTQLHVNGLVPLILGMDDYFLPRTHTPLNKKGEPDFESITAIDLPYFNEHLSALLQGKEIDLPKYNFLSGTREKTNTLLQMKENNILIVEGIHCLNELVSEAIPKEQKVLVYISCLNQLNIDDHNRITTTYFRKLRRIVRDNNFRGYTAEMTLERWPAITEGENKNIFPFQENADIMFNSGLTYEVNVLKKHVLPLLYRISKYSPIYCEAQKMIFLVEHMLDIPDDMVPSNSLLREFIGGSIFKY
ncbi:MAG: nucleoside kinase [Candidatus Cloacimonas sp.]|nr:nucleoside kinase [Candidatus Cloacimonadota bacterium]